MELCKEYKSMNCNERTDKICESFDVDYQLNLPQYLDDVEKLVKCCVKSVISDYELSSSSIKIYGKSIISIMYLNSDGCPLSNIFEEEFAKSFDITSRDCVSFADVCVNNKYYNFRLINQRRIDVHSSLNAVIEIYCNNSNKLLSNCKNAFVREEEINSLVDKYTGVCNADFDETFSILNKDYQIKNIVNSFVNSFVEETKIIKEKMLVKIKNEITIVYMNENNAIEKCAHSFSISKIIDIADCDENDIAFVSVRLSQIYVKSKADDNNYLNNIEAVGRLSISYKINKVSSMTVITDSYIPHFESTLTKQNLQIKRNPIFYFDDKTAEMEFDSDKSIIEVVDLKAEIISCGIVKSVMCFGVLLSYLYYDDNSQLCYFEKFQEFSFTLNDLKLDGNGIVCLKSYDFVIKSTNKISLRLNFEYKAYLYSVETVSCIVDIEDNGRKESVNIPELTLYFANKNERVWDIAKHFSTASQLIMEENDLQSEIIDDARVLLVPGM